MKKLAFTLFITFVLSTLSSFGQNDTINQTINGKKTGYWEKKKPDGTYEWQGYYKKGKQTGYWKFYSEDGLFYYQGKLVDGKKEGAWYETSTKDNTKLDMTKWKKGKCIGGATLSWQ